MDKKLVKFLEEAYQMATMRNDSFDVKFYSVQASGACCYEIVLSMIAICTHFAQATTHSVPAQ